MSYKIQASAWNRGYPGGRFPLESSRIRLGGRISPSQRPLNEKTPLLINEEIRSSRRRSEHGGRGGILKEPSVNEDIFRAELELGGRRAVLLGVLLRRPEVFCVWESCMQAEALL